MNNVPLIDQPDFNPARDRRGDLRVGELSLRVVDGRLVSLDRGDELIDEKLLGVVGLLIKYLFREQFLVALGHRPPVGKICFILRFFGDGFIQLCLVRAGIDLREEVARFDILPFSERHLFQLTIHPCVDSDRVERLDGADAVQVNRHVALLNDTGDHRYRQVGTPTTMSVSACVTSA